MEVVWQHLTQVEAYTEWNPFIVKVDAEGPVTTPGTRMRLTVKWANGGGNTPLEIVKDVVPPGIGPDQKAIWSYTYHSIPARLMMICATRFQVLQSLEEGGVLYQTEEKFEGWGLVFLPHKKVQQGFDAMAAALKKRCEG